jgi:hypothetical protein
MHMTVADRRTDTQTDRQAGRQADRHRIFELQFPFTKSLLFTTQFYSILFCSDSFCLFDFTPHITSPLTDTYNTVHKYHANLKYSFAKNIDCSVWCRQRYTDIYAVYRNEKN